MFKKKETIVAKPSGWSQEMINDYENESEPPIKPEIMVKEEESDNPFSYKNHRGVIAINGKNYNLVAVKETKLMFHTSETLDAINQKLDILIELLKQNLEKKDE